MNTCKSWKTMSSHRQTQANRWKTMSTKHLLHLWLGHLCNRLHIVHLWNFYSPLFVDDLRHLSKLIAIYRNPGNILYEMAPMGDPKWI